MADDSQSSVSTDPPPLDGDVMPLNANPDEEQDTCRICSAPAEPDAPLFHPCKCSGTIRYIHQDCLTTWLAHSKKKNCDVCKHPYAFTKVYATDMPRRLPIFLFVRRSLQQLFFIGLASLRGVVVASVWLAVLPWITVWTWRLYFAMGNTTAWWISARALNDSMNTTFLSNLTVRIPRIIVVETLATELPAGTDATDVALPATTRTFQPFFRSLFSPLVYPSLLRSISADIFTGQIIATAIILIFIAVFLVREFISQNARPGVFDDAEGPPVGVDAERAHRADLEEREMERERERAREHLRQHERDRRRQIRQLALQQRGVQQGRAAIAAANNDTNASTSAAAGTSSASVVPQVGPDGVPRQIRRLPQRSRALPPLPPLPPPQTLPPPTLVEGAAPTPWPPVGPGTSAYSSNSNDDQLNSIRKTEQRLGRWGPTQYRFLPKPKSLWMLMRECGYPDNANLYQYELEEMRKQGIIPAEPLPAEDDPAIALRARLRKGKHLHAQSGLGGGELTDNLPPDPLQDAYADCTEEELMRSIPEEWPRLLDHSLGEVWRARRQKLYALLQGQSARTGDGRIPRPQDAGGDVEGDDKGNLSEPAKAAGKRKEVSPTPVAGNGFDFSFAREDGASFEFSQPGPSSPTLPFALTPSSSTNNLVASANGTLSAGPSIWGAGTQSGNLLADSTWKTSQSQAFSNATAPQSSFTPPVKVISPPTEGQSFSSPSTSTLPHLFVPSPSALSPMRPPPYTAVGGFNTGVQPSSTAEPRPIATFGGTRPADAPFSPNVPGAIGPGYHFSAGEQPVNIPSYKPKLGWARVQPRGANPLVVGRSTVFPAREESEADVNKGAKSATLFANSPADFGLRTSMKRPPPDAPDDVPPSSSGSAVPQWGSRREAPREDGAWENLSAIPQPPLLTPPADRFLQPARPAMHPRTASSPAPHRPTSVQLPVPRRPPMVSSAVPTPTGERVGSSHGDTPMGSPSLATYQPPEAFQEQGYFDGVAPREDEEDERKKIAEEGEERKKMEQERDRYFKEPDDEGEEDAEADGEADEEIEEMERLEADRVAITVRQMEGTDELEMEMEMELDGEAPRPPEDGVHAVAGADQPVNAEGDPNAEVPADGNDGEEQGGERLNEDLGPLAEDVDAVAEDDMEGALEAIGMRGPLFVIVQNAALMTFVLDTAIGLGIWLPFTLGKTAALLSLDPMRALYLIHLPIRMMRVVTDPAVDSVLFLLNRVLLPAFWRLTLVSAMALGWVTSYVADHFVGGQKAAQFALLQAKAQEVYNRSPAELMRVSIAYLRGPVSSPAQPTTATSSLASIFTSTFASIKDRLGADHVIIRHFEQFKAKTISGWHDMVAQRGDMFLRLTLGDGMNERVFAVSLGYAIAGFGLLLYLYMLNIGTVKSAGRAVRSAVRQQVLIVKVVTFILIELFLFPLGCGVNLDFCSIWMFPDASVDTRIAFFKHSPITSIAYHWVIGTMFMYQFAILLAGSRTIMRPGAMWFIKDPSDSNFHPIRDILERPALLQLRKLLFSALMYCLVLTCGVGCVGGLIKALCPTLLPLYWKPRSPLSDVPVDLLFMQTLLPYTLRFFRPKRYIRRVATRIWRFLASRLRLTSYMFGEDAPNEEYTSKEWRLWSGPKYVPKAERPPFDGSYRRVPASDTVVVPREARATAAVDIHGQAVDDEALRLIASQNVEAQLAKRNPQKDYTVVYVPPHFRWRIAAFLLALWVIGCFCVVGVVSIPILTGRQVFRLFTDVEVHDGYSLFAGFYVLWGSFFAGYILEALYAKRTSYKEGVTRLGVYSYIFKRFFVWSCKISYLIATLGVVVPILISLVVEMYFVLPFRFAVNPRTVPRLRMVDMWALGLLYMKIGLKSANARRQQGSVALGIQAIREQGWQRPDPWKATKEVIAPLVAGLLGMLVLPPALAYAVVWAFKLEPDPLFSYHQVYPLLFSCVSIIRSTVASGKYIAAWSRSVRDKEYLVELRLRNFEDIKSGDVAKRQVQEIEPLLGQAPDGVEADGDHVNVQRREAEDDHPRPPPRAGAMVPHPEAVAA